MVLMIAQQVLLTASLSLRSLLFLNVIIADLNSLSYNKLSIYFFMDNLLITLLPEHGSHGSISFSGELVLLKQYMVTLEINHATPWLFINAICLFAKCCGLILQI